MYSVLLRLRTIPALLKCLAVFLGLVTFICTKASPIDGIVEEFCFIVAVVAFGLTLIFLLLFIFRIDNRITVNWAKIELAFAVIASHTYLLISSLIIRNTDDVLRTAAVCGYLTMFTFMIDTCIMYRLVVSGVNGWGYY